MAADALSTWDPGVDFEPNPLLGETVEVDVSFSNDGDAVGFGPYVDLVVPAASGVDYVAGSASLVGNSVSDQIITFDDDGKAVHPLAETDSGAALIVEGNAGDKLVVLTMPFGSFAPEQAALEVDIQVVVASDAQVGESLQLVTSGGFQYGADALDNSDADPSIIGAARNVELTPSVIKLEQFYVGPEHETTSGSNFQRSFQVDVDIATGETLSDIDLQSILDDNVAYQSISTTSFADGTIDIVAEPVVGVAAADQTLSLVIPEMTGVDGVDASFQINFFIPETDATGEPVVSPITGAGQVSVFTHTANADWTTDSADSDEIVVRQVQATTTEQISDQAIAVQQSVRIVQSSGSLLLSVGDVLEYQLDFQVSDYVAIQDLLLNMVVPDGQTYLGSQSTTFTIDGINIDQVGGQLLSDNSALDGSLRPGEEHILFDISSEITARGGGSLIAGGLTTHGNGSGVHGRITLQTVIDNEFEYDFQSGDASVDEGDLMQSTVVATATMLDRETLAASAHIATDNSNEWMVMPTGLLQSELYAINGQTDIDSNAISAGDEVTFRIQRTVRGGDIEELVLNEFFPLPVFALGDEVTFSPQSDMSSGVVSLGPSDNFHSTHSVVPGITVNTASNQVNFDYGNRDWVESGDLKIDLLVTATVQDQPFADGLLLTSQSTSTRGSTNHADNTQMSMDRVIYTRPIMEIVKAVADTDNPAAQFTGATGNRDVIKIDAGDAVSFQVTATNVGSSDEGAHDVTINDSLPSGFEIPDSGLVLTVTDGDGNPLDYVFVDGGNSDSNWFAGGIRLTSPLASVDATDGSNTVVVSYQLKVNDSVLAGETHSSDAEVVHYAALAGGTNYATTRIADDASSRIATPVVNHTLVSTDQPHTSGTSVVIGEKATYETRIAIPEGAMSDAMVRITLYQGLAIDEIVGLSVDDSIELKDQSGAQVLAGAQIRNSNNSLVNHGRLLELNLGDLVNHNHDNGETQYITIQYTTTVINARVNQNGVSRRPVARVYWSDQVVAKSGTSLKIAEPSLQVNKSYSDSVVDAGDKLTVTIDVSHISASSADAFDLKLNDIIPDGVTYVAGSLIALSGSAPDDLSDDAGEFNATWSDLAVGETSRLQYEVIVNDDVHAGDNYTSTAQLQWSSLDAEPGQISQTNSLAFERTGDASDEGGAENDYNHARSQTLSISAPTIQQTIVSSSADHTNGNQLTIGESVTLDIVVSVPEGVHDLALEEALATDRGILDLQSVTLAAVGENLSSDQLVVGTTILGSDSRDDGWGDSVQFDLGTVTNVADSQETVADQLVFTVNALVVDIAANQAGDDVNAVATIHYGSSQTSDTDALRLVESALEATSDFDSAQLDAGDIVTITTQIQTSVQHGSEAIDAYFQNLLDDRNLILQAGTVQTSAGTIVTGNTDGDRIIEVSIGNVDDGELVEIQYQVKVLETTAPGDQLQSQGIVSWNSLVSGEHLRQYNTTTTAAAVVNSTSLRGLVFVDFEQDGEQSTVDFGIGDVMIQISGVDHLGNHVSLSTTSAPGGLYVFEGLRPGDYQISQTQPELFEDGLDYAPTAGGLVENDLIKDIVIPGGSNGDVNGYNFTEAASTWIEGTVYNDFDHNGILGQDEDGIEGVLITLSGTSDEGELVEREVLTNYRGYYVFGYLPSGTYSIAQQQPAGYFDAADSLGTAGGILENDAMRDITVGIGQGKMYNFGEYAPASIQGSVFVDYDRDDLLDRKDGLIAGVAVTLSGVDYTGQIVQLDTVTDIDGKYIFDGLKPGTYDVDTEVVESLELGTVNVGVPSGYDQSEQSAGNAVDYGFRAVVLTSDARAEDYDVGHDDPTWKPSQLETEFAQKHFLKATTGDDTFNVNITENEAVVSLNGSRYTFNSDETRSIVLLGSFGDDTANITGTVNKETVDIRATSATVSGTWFQVRTYGTENFNFVGGGEEDLVRMYDDTSVTSTSHLVTTPFTADYRGDGWHHTVQDIHRIYVYSYNDGDTAVMNGSENRDNFFASHETARMYDGDYYIGTHGFDSVHATANDASDRAYLYDSQGDDVLYANANHATLSGEGYTIVADQYDYVSVDATAGGQDTGVLDGDSGDDRFISRPTTATFLTADTRIIAAGFEVLDGNGNGGDGDRGYLYDSHYNDRLTASPESTVLSNAVNVVSANDFDRVYSYSDAGGDDVATIKGSDGDDKFHSYPTRWTMAGSGYYMFSSGFTQVAAYAGEGYDRAYMYDSASHDVFSANPDWARMQGQRFSNEAYGFDKTYAYSSGGDDQAIFYDASDSRSTLRYNGSSATVFGTGFSHNTRGFKGIDAFYSELSSRDRVELSGLQSINLSEVDIDGLAYKLSLLRDTDAERVSIRDSIDKL